MRIIFVGIGLYISYCCLVVRLKSFIIRNLKMNEIWEIWYGMRVYIVEMTKEFRLKVSSCVIEISCVC